MRFLTQHQVNPANDRLAVAVADEPGQGGASHRYEIYGFVTDTNPSDADSTGYRLMASKYVLLFQNGPIAAGGNGPNGITHEVLLAIVADRLRSFQAGPYACTENANALVQVEGALFWLRERTRARVQRGVEGTHTV